MAGFYGVIDEVLIVEGLFQILIIASEVGVQDISDHVQLDTDTIR